MHNKLKVPKFAPTSITVSIFLHFRDFNPKKCRVREA